MRGWCSISSFVTSDATAEVEVEAEVLEADLFGWKLKLLKGTATASRANYTIALKNLLKSVMWNQKQKQKHRLEAFWLEAVESNPFCFCFLPLLPWKYFEAISRKLKQWCGSGAVLLPLPLPGKSEDCFCFRFCFRFRFRFCFHASRWLPWKYWWSGILCIKFFLTGFNKCNFQNSLPNSTLKFFPQSEKNQLIFFWR